MSAPSPSPKSIVQDDSLDFPRLRRTSYPALPYSQPQSFSTSSTFSHSQEPPYPLSNTESSSSTRTSSSSFTSTSDTSVESDSTPTFSLPHYHSEKSKHSISAQDYSRRLLHSLRPRRRSSLPFIHLARRKSTQLALTGAIVVLGILLLGELRIQRARRRLWDQDIAISAWDVRHTGSSDREINLAVYRANFERDRRRQVTQEQIDDHSAAGGQIKAWGPAEEAALKSEVDDAWPRWWGSADVVGPSPFDYSPGPLAPIKEKQRLLFLTDYNDYLERMNTHTYEIVDAALRHPHLIVDVWGPGWAGYDRSIPLSANVRKRSHRLAQLEQSQAVHQEKQRLMQESKAKERRRRERREWLSQALEVTRAPGKKQLVAYENEGDTEMEQWEKPEWLEDVPEWCSDAKFDVVLTISNIYKEDDPHVDALDCGSLLVQQIGDCHSLVCSYEWYPHASNITLSKYSFELLELFNYETVKSKYPNWEIGLFGHSPDTANEWDFYPVPWANKTSEAKIFGFDGSFYPIRTTVTDYLRDRESNPLQFKSAIIERHPHPGYTVSVSEEARQQPLETYEVGHEYYVNHLALREDFAKGMREAKVCVFDASLERKMIRKYAQAFLSGCVVAADLPTEQEEALSRFVIPLKTNWSIEQINAAIQYYLDRPDILQQMAMDAFIYARRSLTTTSKISGIMRLAEHHREGSRGYEFPHAFSMRCRAYWSGEDGYKPPWCSQNGYRGLEA